MNDDEIIAAIYDAIFDPVGWDAVAKAFADRVGGSSCFILDSDADGSSLRVLSGRGLESAGVPEYQEHFHRLDIWKQRLLSDRSGRTVPFQELVPQPVFQNSEIFNDWVKPALAYEVYWGLGRRFDLNGGRVGLIGVHRPRRRSEMGAIESQAIERYIPHVRRALRLRQSLDLAQARSGALEQLCDVGPGAMILVDARGRIDYGNRAALALLHRRDGLSLDKDGRLRAATSLENEALHRRIAAACERQFGADGASDEVPLRIGGGTAGPLLVTVAPVPAERFALPYRLAILCVEDSLGGPVEIDPRKIAVALSVTASEATLVAMLARGGGLRQAAASLGIAYNTARTQLRSVFEKSGIKRQSELMLRVSKLR